MYQWLQWRVLYPKSMLTLAKVTVAASSGGVDLEHPAIVREVLDHPVVVGQVLDHPVVVGEVRHEPIGVVLHRVWIVRLVLAVLVVIVVILIIIVTGVAVTESTLTE